MLLRVSGQRGSTSLEALNKGVDTPLESLWTSRGRCLPHATLFQLCYDQHVFEVCRVVVKVLHQLERLLPLCPIEELHLIGQALSLVDSLQGRNKHSGQDVNDSWGGGATSNDSMDDGSISTLLLQKRNSQCRTSSEKVAT